MHTPNRGEQASGLSQRYWISSLPAMAVIAASGILPFVAYLLGWGHWTWRSPDIHTALELVCSLAGIAIAFTLLVSNDAPLDGTTVLACTGLTGIAIFDAVHAFSPIGQAFVLLRAAGLLVAGSIFAFVWVPVAVRFAEGRRSLMTFAAALATAMAVPVILFPGMLPPLIADRKSTGLALAMNLASGILLTSAIPVFIVRYGQTRLTRFYVFASLTGLIAASGVVLRMSTLWEDSWWCSHFMRLAAYLAGMAYILQKFAMILTPSSPSQPRFRARLSVPLVLTALIMIMVLTAIDAVELAFGSPSAWQSRVATILAGAAMATGIAWFILRRWRVFLDAATADRLQAEKRLREHQERLEALVEARTSDLHKANVDLEDGRKYLEDVNAQLVQAVERANHMTREAEHANKAKSEFLANMSHEIRTPLTAILGYTDLLREDAGNPGQQGQHIAVIRRNGEHLLGLVNDILDLSRIEAGQFTLSLQSCRVQSVLADVLSMMRVRAAEKHLDLAVRYATPVPETIMADEPRLRQCLINLVVNAIKFTDVGGVLVEVRYAAGTGGTIRFHVIDTGQGIDAQTQQRLFRPFVQADTSTSRKYGGSGLGLAITRRIIETMGGQVSLRSAPGQGSTVTIEIPAGPLDGVRMIDRPEEAMAAPPEHHLAPDSRSLKGLRILLAEDGPDNQRLISAFLHKAGAEVDLAQNGREVVAKAGSAAYDLILMDMQMPEVDGYQATAQLRRSCLAIPIVALTAHALPGDRERCLQAGCTDYVTKPIDRSALIENHSPSHIPIGAGSDAPRCPTERQCRCPGDPDLLLRERSRSGQGAASVP